MDEARLRGEETSLNPLGMVEGLLGAMNHAADVHGGSEEMLPYTANIRAVIHRLFREGRGTRDLCGAGAGGRTNTSRHVVKRVLVPRFLS